jgi:hypothetical protein
MSTNSPLNALIIFRDLQTREIKVAPTMVVWHYRYPSGSHEVGANSVVEEVTTVTAEKAITEVARFLAEGERKCQT